MRNKTIKIKDILKNMDKNIYVTVFDQDEYDVLGCGEPKIITEWFGEKIYSYFELDYTLKNGAIHITI